MHMDGEKDSLKTLFVTTQLSLGIFRVCGVLPLIFSWHSKRGDFLMFKLSKLLRLLAVFQVSRFFYFFSYILIY